MKTRASLAWAFLYHDSNPYIKKSFERTANNILPQELENHCITSSSYWVIFLILLSFFVLFIWARGIVRGLCFHPCSRLSSSPTYEHVRWPRKVSNILRTSVKFSKNPSGIRLQNCFIQDQHNETNRNSYYTGADLEGGCRGCAPLPPEMTCGFLIQLVFCKEKKTMWFIGVEV